MTMVRCPTCLRIERWKAPDQHDVVQEGGARRPDTHPNVAAWRILHAAQQGRSGPVVAACPACTLPMVADDAGTPALAEWRLQLDVGEVVVTDSVSTPDGPLSWDDADRWMTARYHVPVTAQDAASNVAQAGFMALFTVPLLLWVGALSLVFFVVWSIAEGRVEMHQH